MVTLDAHMALIQSDFQVRAGIVRDVFIRWAWKCASQCYMTSPHCIDKAWVDAGIRAQNQEWLLPL